MKRSAILFDLDGTLVDSLPDLAAAANALLAELGFPALGESAIASMVGDGVGKLVERVLTASGTDGIPLAAAIDRFLTFYEADATRLTRPYPDVVRVLGELDAAGCRLAICTNKPERATLAILKGLELSRFFAIVLGGDSLPVQKPDPRPLLAALDRLDVAPSAAAMVGDHRNDMAAARGAGVAAIFARYGYGREPRDEVAPHKSIARFAELPEALRSLRII
jgi:phosphoglycolate phosphatase